MARSNYVYVVVPVGAITPIAGFTVKHELLSFLERQAVNLRIWRIRDYRHCNDAERAAVDITKECYD